MKEKMMILVACAMLAACQQQKRTTGNENSKLTSAVDTTATDSMRFEGILPAADCPGIRYSLAIANDSTKGFAVTQTYIEAEKGKDLTFAYKGVAEVISKTVNGKEVKAYKLNLGKDESTDYFKIVNDSTLRMVNQKLEELDTKMNFDIKKK